MNRLKQNIIVDVAMLLAMAVTSISGWVIKFFVRSGGGARSPLAAREFMGLDRHAWRDIHLWAGVVLVALLVVHIALHWSTISAFFRREIPNRVVRIIVYVVMLVVVAATTLPWLLVAR